MHISGQGARLAVIESLQGGKISWQPFLSLTTDQDIIRTYDLDANTCVVNLVDLDQLMVIVNKIERFWFTIVRLPKE
jgi:hypothetical protein